MGQLGQLRASWGEPVLFRHVRPGRDGIPFTMLKVAPHGRTPIQFVGPPGSKHGTIFAGEAIYPSPETIPSTLDPAQFGSAARLDSMFK